MIIILATILIIAVVYVIVFMQSEYRRQHEEAIGCSLALSAIALVILLFCWGGSYASYVELHQLRANFEPKLILISSYAEKATQTFQDVNGKEITDLKYNHYQETLGEMMKDFRKDVSRHNNILVGKNTMKKNIIFSWLIIAPDPDMKKVDVVDLLKKY